MVLLPSADAFDPTPAITWLHEHSRGLPAIMDFTTDGGVATGQIAGGSVGLAQMPVPIPEGDLEGPTRLAWHWPEAADAVAQHQSHVIVHASSSELDPLTLRLLVTRLAAAVVATGNGLGVYVGDACMVRSAEDFAEQAQAASSEAFPLLLWVSFNLVSDAPGWSAYTMGLTALGHLELEAHHSALTPPQLLGRLADAAYYQLSSGRVLRDGDTFGASASERIRVRHRTSEFLPDVTVAVLDL
jgi:hypothetical protein